LELHVGVLHRDESVVHPIGTGVELDEEDLSLFGEDEVVGVGDVEKIYKCHNDRKIAENNIYL
jgi:hypothetical protein